MSRKQSGRRTIWTVLLYGAAMAIASEAQTVTTLVNFQGPGGIGSGPFILGADGNFYGISQSNGQIPAFFQMTLAGTLTTLSASGSLGSANSLVQASDGNFYGTTFDGGFNNWGTIFEITPSGAFTVTTFQDLDGNYGIDPNGGLIQATDGNFYGTTQLGGENGSDFGTVFKVTPGGTLTTLHTFAISDGVKPMAGLVQAADGNFYGTTTFGGAGNCPFLAALSPSGCGTVFKITVAGTFTLLYNFGTKSSAAEALADGANPIAGLIQAIDGDFYGMTASGGIASCQGSFNVVGAGGCGTIFKITPTGELTTLYSFGATPTDGSVPEAGLIQAGDGNLYGTTTAGGSNSCTDTEVPGIGCGTIFRITPGGSYTTLYSFGAGLVTSNQTSTVGYLPETGLIQASDGNFYGTTALGGAHLGGTIFRLSLASPDAPAIVPTGGVLNGASFQPAIGADSWITIKGTNLAPATDNWNSAIVNGALPTSLDGVRVMVGDQPAYIEYVSSTQINALAPNVAAGTFPVTVTTSIGTSQAVMVDVAAVQPAFFQWGNYVVATRQDFSLAVKNGTFPGTTTVPAAPGEVIILWGTGFGPTSPSAPEGVEAPATATYNTATAVTVTVGNQPAKVYGAALAPGYAGLYQVAIEIPGALTNGDYPVVATVSGAQSSSTTLITVQQ